MTNKQFFQQCWRNDLGATLVALKALPEAEKLSYRPAQRNRSAKELVDHFVSHVEDLIEGVKTGVINHRVTASYSSIPEAIEVFEKGSNELLSLLDKVDDQTWEEKNVPMLVFGTKFMEHSLGDMCWTFLFDIIHHRGQLSTYYRPMGAAQPSIYGPTSEMVEAMMSGAASN